MSRIEIRRAFKPRRHGAPIPRTPTVIFRVTALKRAHLAYHNPNPGLGYDSADVGGTILAARARCVCLRALGVW
eukprot:COSAG02_NODE_248_length_27133_cov_45.131723_1_plen_74_part_00